MPKLKDVKLEIQLRLKEITANYIFEANQIINHVCNISSTSLNFCDKMIEPDEYDKIIKMCKKRCSRYPLQYILGEWDFYGNTYIVSDGVLIPRSDTEVLCETILNYFKGKKNLVIADLCAGTGCIGITLEKNLVNPSVHAFEKYDDAYELLLKNIELNKSNVKPYKIDVLLDIIPLKEVDVIVSNPPYLTKSDMESLQREVSFEPQQALFGGVDGMEFYRGITQRFTPLIRVDGVLAFEIGLNQSKEVYKILEDNCYKKIEFVRDVNNIKRVIYGVKS